jgi:hypothetical protein
VHLVTRSGPLQVPAQPAAVRHAKTTSHLPRTPRVSHFPSVDRLPLALGHQTNLAAEYICASNPPPSGDSLVELTKPKLLGPQPRCRDNTATKTASCNMATVPGILAPATNPEHHLAKCSCSTHRQRPSCQRHSMSATTMGRCPL